MKSDRRQTINDDMAVLRNNIRKQETDNVNETS